jgi:hypothetical protein
MADIKTFNVGEVLSSADTNEYLRNGYWDRIDRVRIPSGLPVSSVTFSGINTSYRVFKIIASTSRIMSVTLNNDNAANYENQVVQFNGASVSSSRSESNTSISTTIGDQPALMEITIGKVATGVVGLALSHGSSYFSANPYLQHTSSSWNNTSSLINRIDCISTAGTFYGVIALEGLISI